VTIPYVRVDYEQLFQGHKVMVVSGVDTVGLNDVTDPPAS